ncbi:hypothetical protein [Bacillus atrophaeus]|uniref:hypothetical protein n=1 Tax=Bacillus atrophaeus TaxID=1452 RepID=UPI0021627076|nr:hypothetical protein [Bacillus atrophaeus]
MRVDSIFLKKLNNLLQIQNEDNLKTSIYGFLSSLILSKELFKSNKDLKDFFKTLKMDHKDYVYASRTLLVAHTIRKVKKEDIKFSKTTVKNIIHFLTVETVNEKVIHNNYQLKVDDNYVMEVINKYKRGK